MRITKEMLEGNLNYINRLTGVEHTLESSGSGKYKLCRANGSVNVFPYTTLSKSKLYDMMQAYARGLELSMECPKCTWREENI